LSIESGSDFCEVSIGVLQDISPEVASIIMCLKRRVIK